MWTYCANSHDTADELNKLRISTAKNKCSQGVEPGTDYLEQIELGDSKSGAQSVAYASSSCPLGRQRAEFVFRRNTDGAGPGSRYSKAD